MLLSSQHTTKGGLEARVETASVPSLEPPRVLERVLFDDLPEGDLIFLCALLELIVTSSLPGTAPVFASVQFRTVGKRMDHVIISRSPPEVSARPRPFFNVATRLHYLTIGDSVLHGHYCLVRNIRSFPSFPVATRLIQLTCTVSPYDFG
ncbi:hypothetical protein G9A89_000596 [Geosiphon pyriformis]|nr:hypothetical protein G9A89_000596 [Geosiphon pyriformis]